MNLSVCVITYNEEWIIGKTIDAVKDIADEIIVVDSFSTDKTVEIAQSLGAKVYQEVFKGDGPQKNSAITKCSGRWVLYLDADEVVSSNLKEQIRVILSLNTSETSDIYFVRFQTYCFGRHVRFGNCKSFFRVRLFKNGAGLFNNNRVHGEYQIASNKSVAKLNSDIFHYTFKDLEHYVYKMNFYTSEKAHMAISRGKKPNIFKMLLSPLWGFIKMYFLKLGFLDGFDGLQLAFLNLIYSIIHNFKHKELFLKR